MKISTIPILKTQPNPTFHTSFSPIKKKKGNIKIKIRSNKSSNKKKTTNYYNEINSPKSLINIS